MSTSKPGSKPVKKEPKVTPIVTEKGGVALTPYELFKEIQDNIKVPKTKWNKFSSFFYRSVEDIYNAWKDLQVPLILKLTDEAIERAGRVFVETLAEIKDMKGNVVEFSKAQAELGTGKAGMSSEQATGSASSYARKFALNGLFLLDDAKDPDEDETSTTGPSGAPSEVEKVSVKVKELQELIRGDKVATAKATTELKGRSILKLTVEEIDTIIKAVKETKATTESK